jgi:hypothetical protein
MVNVLMVRVVDTIDMQPNALRLRLLLLRPPILCPLQTQRQQMHQEAVQQGRVPRWIYWSS